jgi:peptidoglycan/LPS O-acetylase OafA/YrhL
MNAQIKIWLAAYAMYLWAFLGSMAMGACAADSPHPRAELLIVAVVVVGGCLGAWRLVTSAMDEHGRARTDTDTEAGRDQGDGETPASRAEGRDS